MLTGRDHEDGHSELWVFYRLQVSAPEKHNELFIYISFFATYSCHFCLSDQCYIQNKHGLTIQYCLTTHYFRSQEVNKTLGLNVDNIYDGSWHECSYSCSDTSG